MKALELAVVLEGWLGSHYAHESKVSTPARIGKPVKREPGSVPAFPSGTCADTIVVTQAFLANTSLCEVQLERNPTSRKGSTLKLALQAQSGAKRLTHGKKATG